MKITFVLVDLMHLENSNLNFLTSCAFHFYFSTTVGKSQQIWTKFGLMLLRHCKIESPKETYVSSYSASCSWTISCLMLLCARIFLTSIDFPHPEGPNKNKIFFRSSRNQIIMLAYFLSESVNFTINQKILDNILTQ